MYISLYMKKNMRIFIHIYSWSHTCIYMCMYVYVCAHNMSISSLETSLKWKILKRMWHARRSSPHGWLVPPLRPLRAPRATNTVRRGMSGFSFVKFAPLTLQFGMLNAQECSGLFQTSPLKTEVSEGESYWNFLLKFHLFDHVVSMITIPRHSMSLASKWKLNTCA